MYRIYLDGVFYGLFHWEQAIRFWEDHGGELWWWSEGGSLSAPGLAQVCAKGWVCVK